MDEVEAAMCRSLLPFCARRKTLNLRNFAFALGAELAFFGMQMRRATEQDLISLHPRCHTL
jgi:hypothetical protein